MSNAVLRGLSADGVVRLNQLLADELSEDERHREIRSPSSSPSLSSFYHLSQ